MSLLWLSLIPIINNLTGGKEPFPNRKRELVTAWPLPLGKLVPRPHSDCLKRTHPHHSTAIVGFGEQGQIWPVDIWGLCVLMRHLLAGGRPSCHPLVEHGTVLCQCRVQPHVFILFLLLIVLEVQPVRELLFFRV